MTRKKTSLTLRALVEGAIFVAAAQALSMLKLWEMPWGGSVTLAMLPLIFFCVRWGLGPGLLACFIFGVLQFVLDGAFAFGWQSIVGDYLVAFAAIGFSGLARGTRGNVFTGSLAGGFARFIVHYVVGATVWAEYMPESFFGMTMHTPWFYSLLYNLAYMIPNIAICLIVFAVLYRPLGRYMRGEDIRR